MKLSLVLLTLGALAGTSALQAQSIRVDTPTVPLANNAQSAANTRSTAPTMSHKLSMNWARVTAMHDAAGKLVAQCTVEPNPVFAAARQREDTKTTDELK